MDEKEKVVGDTATLGGCPFPWCHRNDGVVNIRTQFGTEHWVYCKEHRLKWFIGIDPPAKATGDKPDRPHDVLQPDLTVATSSTPRARKEKGSPIRLRETQGAPQEKVGCPDKSHG